MKQCSKCKINKLNSEFSKHRFAKDELQSWCRTCIRIAVREHQTKAKEFFVEYKRGLNCQECGENHIACLDFHHKNPDEKEFEISQRYGTKSIEIIMNEIAKCDVLCANCHRKLHYNFKNEGDRK